MMHLHAERLAALADESPTSLEAADLEHCPECSGEVSASRQLLARASAAGSGGASERAGSAAGALSRFAPGSSRLIPEVAKPPLTDWSTLAARLRREGVLPPAEVVEFPVSGEFRAARRPGRWRRRPVYQLAAATLLLCAGTVFGRMSAGAPVLPGSGLESAGLASGAPVTPGSESEALLLMAEAEAQYRQAAAYLAAMEVEGGYVLEQPEALQTRLAALDEVGAVTREALHAAPHDPVLNQYYLASQGARAATIRQIDRAGTPAMLVGSY